MVEVGYRKITIAYVAQKVRWNVVCLKKTREQLAQIEFLGEKSKICVKKSKFFMMKSEIYSDWIHDPGASRTCTG